MGQTFNDAEQTDRKITYQFTEHCFQAYNHGTWFFRLTFAVAFAFLSGVASAQIQNTFENGQIVIK